jgi:hypothetical protein
LDTLFSDAERTEDRPKQIVTAVAASDFTEGMLGMSQFFGGEFAGATAGEHVGCLIEIYADLLQGMHMPTACAERAFSTAGTCQLLQMLAQRVETGAGFRRGP